MGYCVRTVFVLFWTLIILVEYSVQPRTYTLKEAVSILHRSGGEEEATRITRHIRHWTSLDLLVPVGDKHMGTGRSREYPVEEIYRAAVLLELAKWRAARKMVMGLSGSSTRPAKTNEPLHPENR